MRRNDYRIAASSGSRRKRGYSSAEIDFLAAYVIPCDAWYIIPVAAFDSIVSLNVAPHRPANGRFEKFREAWHLLRAPCHSEPAAAVEEPAFVSHRPTGHRPLATRKNCHPERSRGTMRLLS
jgi:hypothetical protein